MDALLYEFVVIAGLSGVVIVLCGRLGLSPISGYLLAGALCGPFGLGLVKNMEAVRGMADIGLVFLMFAVGMQFSLSRLSQLRWAAFLGGPLQVLGTVAVVVVCAVRFGLPLSSAVFVGCLLAFSSTAIVLSLLQQQGEGGSLAGRFSLAVLIFQGLAAMVVMLAIPLLSGRVGMNLHGLLLVAGRMLAAGLFVLVTARVVAPRLLRLVARSGSRELFLICLLGLCLGTAWVSGRIGLSLTFGAFLAGLVAAESEYGYSTLEGVLPLKDVLGSLFFVSMGMLLDLRFVGANLAPVLSFALLLVLGKGLIAGAAARLLGCPLRVAVMVGLALGQTGEFSFVLARTGLEAGLLLPQNYQMFLAVGIVSMTATPLLMAAAPRLTRFLGDVPGTAAGPLPLAKAAPERTDHIIIIGFGPAGRLCAWAAAKAKLDYVVLEMNADTVGRYARQGEPIFFGDAVHPGLLEHFGIGHARCLVLAVSDPATTTGIVRAARVLNPNLRIIARTRFIGEVKTLKTAGADEIVAEEFETSIEVFTRMLDDYKVSHGLIRGMVEKVREKNYSALRYALSNDDGLESMRAALPGLRVAVMNVSTASRLANATIAELKDIAQVGLTVLGVKREETQYVHPGSAFRFLPGDVAYLVLSERDRPLVSMVFSS